MNHDDARILNRDFKIYLADKGLGSKIDELKRAINPVLNNPYIDDMSTIFSDWQGHAAISMKRALVSIATLCLVQLFIFNEAFLAQLTMYGVQVNDENYGRIKVVIILSLAISGILYMSAVLRDKKNRDFRAYQLRDSLNAYLRLYNELKANYEKFMRENAQLKTDFKAAIMGPVAITSTSDKFRKAELYKDKYEQLLKPNQKNQLILDIYDIYIIPIVGVVTIGLVIVT